MDATLDDLPLFRRTDPVTSRIAGREARGFRGEHHRLILEALAVSPGGASGIAQRCGLVPHQVGRRLHELALAGEIVKTGRLVESASGRPEREWAIRGSAG